MSLYDDASLVLIPDGAKAGKLYSVKPTDGSGDFTFSRSTVANRIDGDGANEEMAIDLPRIDYRDGSCPDLLIEPERTNLFLNSQTGATQTVTVSSGTEYTVSFSGTGTIAFTGGYTGSLVGTGSDRVSVTFTTTSTSVTCTVSGTVQYVNFEEGGYDTSWIETTGSSATRSGDVTSVSYNVPSSGSIYVSLSDYKEDEFTILSYEFAASTIKNDIAIAFSPTTLKVSHNGTIVIDETGTYDTTSMTNIDLGHDSGTDQLGGGINSFLVFDRILTDTELNSLTI